jgi:hypothetical protein
VALFQPFPWEQAPWGIWEGKSQKRLLTPV